MKAPAGNTPPENTHPENTIPKNTARRLTGGNHPDYLLTAYLFESISEEGRRAVEAHLAGCVACREELEELRGTLGLVRHAVPDASGDAHQYSFSERRLQRVLAAKAERNPLSRLLRLNSPPRRVWIPAVASAAVILFGFLILVPSLARKEMSTLREHPTDDLVAFSDLSAKSASEGSEFNGAWHARSRRGAESRHTDTVATGGVSLAPPSLPGGSAGNGTPSAGDPTFEVVTQNNIRAADEQPLGEPDAPSVVSSRETGLAFGRPSSSVSPPERATVRTAKEFTTLVPEQSKQQIELSAEVLDEETGEAPAVKFDSEVIRPGIPKGSSLDSLSNLNLQNSIHDAIGIGGGAAGADGEPRDISEQLARKPRRPPGSKPPGIPPETDLSHTYRDYAEPAKPAEDSGGLSVSDLNGDSLTDLVVTDRPDAAGSESGAMEREQRMEEQSRLGVFYRGDSNSGKEAEKQLEGARKHRENLATLGGASPDDTRALLGTLALQGKEQKLKQNFDRVLQSGDIKITERFFDNGAFGGRAAGRVRLGKSLEEDPTDNDSGLEGWRLAVKRYDLEEEGDKKSAQTAATQELYAWKEGASVNGQATDDFYAGYSIPARGPGTAGKTITMHPYVLERGLRAYKYYRTLDPDLSLEAFSARTLTVPSPAVGDEGLGREEFRKRYSVNPFVDTLRDHFSTFGMDVDTASYTFIRNLLRSGKLPDPSTVRTEEWINYFRGVHEADPDQVFSVFAEGGPSPFGDSLELLKITVKAREVRPGERRPLVLTFAVDTSGSMAVPVSADAAERGVRQGDISAESRLALVRHALSTLVGALEPQDRVALVAYSTHPYLVLPHTPARERSRILGAIDSLEPTGATNVEAGVDLAYRVADEVFEPKAVNRVVLCSDGVANLGARGPEEILQKVQVFAKRGMYLSCVGFGMGGYNDKMLETLADQGNGKYTYVDTPAEAEKLFGDELSSTLDVLAQDAKIQVDFNSEVVSHYRLLGYENRDIRDQDFRNDKVDAGEVGPGSTVTVLYEIRRRANPRGDLGKIYLRYRDTASKKIEEVNYPLRAGVLTTELSEASDRFRFIAAVAETAELLRDSYWAQDGSYGKVLGLLGTLSEEFRSRGEVQEFAEIVLRAQALTIQALADPQL